MSPCSLQLESLHSGSETSCAAPFCADSCSCCNNCRLQLGGDPAVLHGRGVYPCSAARVPRQRRRAWAGLLLLLHAHRPGQQHARDPCSSAQPAPERRRCRTPASALELLLQTSLGRAWYTPECDDLTDPVLLPAGGDAVVSGPAQEQQRALCGLLRGLLGLAAAGRLAGASAGRDPGRQGAARGRLRVQQGRLLADFCLDVAACDAGLQPGHVVRLFLRLRLSHRGPSPQPISPSAANRQR